MTKPIHIHTAAHTAKTLQKLKFDVMANPVQSLFHPF
jgi:hypothetical protein